jgi:hypothetical protein
MCIFERARTTWSYCDEVEPKVLLLVHQRVGRVVGVTKGHFATFILSLRYVAGLNIVDTNHGNSYYVVLVTSHRSICFRTALT